VRAAQEVLHALASGSPDEVLVGGQVSGLVQLVGLDQLATNFVGHALELGESNVGLGAAGLHDGTALADGLGVVRGDDKAGNGVLAGSLDISVPLAGEDTGGEGVEASVGVFLGIVEELAGVGVQVSATDKLDTESKALLLSKLEVLGENRGALLLVGLVGTEDDSLTETLVVLAHELESPVIDTVLEHVLLGVEEETDTSLVSKLADGVDGLVHGGAGTKTLLELVKSDGTSTGELESDKVASLSKSDSLERASSPGEDIVLDSLVGLDSGVLEVVTLVLGENNLLGVVQNDTVETNVLESIDSLLDLG